MIYVGHAFNTRGRPNNIPYELFPIFIPFIYGLFGILNYIAISQYGDNMSLVVGGIFGILLSFIGRFYLDLPQKMFNFTSNNEHMVHLYAFFLYAIVFRGIMTPILNYVIV